MFGDRTPAEHSRDGVVEVVVVVADVCVVVVVVENRAHLSGQCPVALLPKLPSTQARLHSWHTLVLWQ